MIGNISFDIVKVGGGTAGCVLASRLSEHANRSVLLIDAIACATSGKGTLILTAYCNGIAPGGRGSGFGGTQTTIETAGTKRPWRISRLRILGALPLRSARCPAASPLGGGCLCRIS